MAYALLLGGTLTTVAKPSSEFTVSGDVVLRDYRVANLEGLGFQTNTVVALFRVCARDCSWTITIRSDDFDRSWWYDGSDAYLTYSVGRTQATQIAILPLRLPYEGLSPLSATLWTAFGSGCYFTREGSFSEAPATYDPDLQATELQRATASQRTAPYICARPSRVHHILWSNPRRYRTEAADLYERFVSGYRID